MFSSLSKVITLIATSTLLLACSSTDHLSFKGVPIDGSFDLFTKRMIEKGFTVSDSGPTVQYVRGKEIMTEQVYDGIFWSDDPFSKVEVSAFGTDVTGTVYKVLAVMIQEFDAVEYMFVEDFGKYAEMLREKYGEPVIKQYSDDDDVFFFEEKESDGKKMSLSSAKSLSKEIENMGFFGTAKYSYNFKKPSEEALEQFAEEKSGCYAATYETENGFIRLVLSLKLDTWGEDYNDYGLGFIYLDKKNFDKYKRESDEYLRLRKTQQIDDL